MLVSEYGLAGLSFSPSKHYKEKPVKEWQAEAHPLCLMVVFRTSDASQVNTSFTQVTIMLLASSCKTIKFKFLKND